MRRLQILAFAIFLLSPCRAQAEGGYAQLVNDFVGITKGILTGGAALFDQLATTQVLGITDDLYSEAIDLERAKRELRKRLENDSVDRREMDILVLSLVKRVKDLGETTNRFSREIDKVSGLSAGPLRMEAQMLIGGKVEELHYLRFEWQPGNQASKDKALMHLFCHRGHGETSKSERMS